MRSPALRSLWSYSPIGISCLKELKSPHSRQVVGSSVLSVGWCCVFISEVTAESCPVFFLWDLLGRITRKICCCHAHVWAGKLFRGGCWLQFLWRNSTNPVCEHNFTPLQLWQPSTKEEWSSGPAWAALKDKAQYDPVKGWLSVCCVVTATVGIIRRWAP